MKLVKCKNGHFYDEERYTGCPHCSESGRNDNMTVPVMRTPANDEVTVAMSGQDSAVTMPQQSAAPTPVQQAAAGRSLQEAVQAAGIQGADLNSDKTVGFYSHTIGSEPVVGWLVCVEGEHFGEDFKLKSGRNFIGRSSGMDVCIVKDTTVSREKHSIVVYEPKGNVFLVQPGESKELCYLNDKVVLSPAELHPHDRLTVGKTELMFIPCCTEHFNWDMAKAEKK